jgi:hypothetical protein
MFYIKYALAQQWQGQMMVPDYMYFNMIIQKGWEVTKKVRPFWLWTGVRTLVPFEYRSKWCKLTSGQTHHHSVLVEFQDSRR